MAKHKNKRKNTRRKTNSNKAVQNNNSQMRRNSKVIAHKQVKKNILTENQQEVITEATSKIDASSNQEIKTQVKEKSPELDVKTNENKESEREKTLNDVTLSSDESDKVKQSQNNDIDNEKSLNTNSPELDEQQKTENNSDIETSNNSSVLEKAEDSSKKIGNCINQNIDRLKQVKQISKLKIFSNKLFLSHLSVAIISAVASCTIFNMHIIKNRDGLTNNSSNVGQDMGAESSIRINDIMAKIESNNLIKINPTYPLDYTFDSIFDNIRDDALAVETSVLSNKNNLQEIFLIKTSDTETAELELKKYQESLIELYKEKHKKDQLKIAKNIVIKSKKDITYFIAAENYNEIQKLIEQEIQ